LKIIPKTENENIIKGGKILIKKYIDKKIYEKYQDFFAELKIIFLEQIISQNYTYLLYWNEIINRFNIKNRRYSNAYICLENNFIKNNNISWKIKDIFKRSYNSNNIKNLSINHKQPYNIKKHGIVAHWNLENNSIIIGKVLFIDKKRILIQHLLNDDSLNITNIRSHIIAFKKFESYKFNSENLKTCLSFINIDDNLILLN
jgi:hypothetical protein